METDAQSKVQGRSPEQVRWECTECPVRGSLSGVKRHMRVKHKIADPLPVDMIVRSRHAASKKVERPNPQAESNIDCNACRLPHITKHTCGR